MDQNGFDASAKEIRGAVKLVDAKLVSDGKAGKVDGKVQNAVGSHDAVLEEICARLRDSLPAIEITTEHFPANRIPVRVSKKFDKTIT